MLSHLTALPTHSGTHAAALLRHVHPLRAPLIRLGRIDDPFLDVGGQVVESLLDIDVALRRDLHERNLELVR